jgi:hypothetical protein
MSKGLSRGSVSLTLLRTGAPVSRAPKRACPNIWIHATNPAQAVGNCRLSPRHPASSPLVSRLTRRKQYPSLPKSSAEALRGSRGETPPYLSLTLYALLTVSSAPPPPRPGRGQHPGRLEEQSIVLRIHERERCAVLNHPDCQPIHFCVK